MEHYDRRESVFDLIRSMSKAEKRNFKLYAARQGDPRESKFIILFDCLEGMESYDEERILSRCPSIRKEQLPNMKAHLHRQILISCACWAPRSVPAVCYAPSAPRSSISSKAL